MKKTLLTLLSVIPLLAGAQNWNGNPAQNNVVANTSASGTKTNPTTAKDQQNNVFVVWEDNRNTATTGTDIYIQKINKDGSMAWAANGIPVCTATGTQSAPSIVADGNDGVIVVWTDARGGSATKIYVQRIDASGNIAYAADGLQLLNNSATQSIPLVKMVNSTEAMIFFRDNRNTNIDLFIHKININTGATVWASDVTVVAATGTQANHSILADGSGGAYLAWGDPRTGTSDSDIYIQHINNAGTVSWTANGINITPGATANQIKPAIALDELNGGFFVTWQDLRSGSTDANIYVQKVKADGTTLWTASGVLVCSSANSQDYPSVVSAGDGGAVIAWVDPRDGTSARKLFAQRMDANGAIQWTGNGVNIATNQVVPNSAFTLVKGQTAGTAIVVWSDTRNASTTNDIYAQKLNTDGTKAWNSDGLIVCNASGSQGNMQAETDGADNIIAVWTDGRSGTANTELYASNILANGVLPVTFSGIQAKLSGNAVMVNWKVESEINTVKYLIERRGDAQNFTEIGYLSASAKSNYNFTDINPLSGNNYYRIKAVDADGTLSYSDIAQVAVGLNNGSLQVYPNPFVAELKIKLNQIFIDKLYNFTLTDITGKIQFSETVNGANLQGIYPINVANLNKGMYFLTIKQGNEKVSYPVVKN